MSGSRGGAACGRASEKRTRLRRARPAATERARMAPEMDHGSRRAGMTLPRKLASAVALATAAGALALACNAAVGGAAVALVGGAGYVAAQCYDRIRLKVRDQRAGEYTCDADVTVAEGDSERSLRPCYSAALTSGTYRFTARRAGYVPASTELRIADREGDCPNYTRSIELTLRAEGDPAAAAQLAPQQKPAPAPAAPAAPTTPAQPAEPAVPTRSFDLVSTPDAGAARPSP